MKTLILSILIKITLVDINTNERLPGVKVITDQNIYYSKSDGNIVKTNLVNLKNDDQHYSRYYRNCRR